MSKPAHVDRTYESGYTRFTVPHRWIAEKTGYTVAGISRLRTPGSRDTTFNTERAEHFEKVFKWSVRKQYAAHKAGVWLDEFERVVLAAYEKTKPLEDPTPTWLAERTGYSKKALYLMRTAPIRDIARVMPRFEKIAEVFDWPVEDQTAAAEAGTWAEGFENVTRDAYRAERASAREGDGA